MNAFIKKMAGLRMIQKMKTLDFDNNINRWLPAFDAVMSGEKPVCPKCGSKDLDSLVRDIDGGIGFVTITCNKCGKTGYFSRVQIYSVVLTGEMLQTSMGTAIVYNEQDYILKVGERIHFKESNYIIKSIIPSSRPNGKLSIIVKKIQSYKRLNGKEDSRA